ANKFAAFLTNPENVEKLATHYPSTRESLLKPEILVGHSEVLTGGMVQPIVDATKEIGRIVSDGVNDAQGSDGMSRALNKHVWQENADIAEAMQSVCAEIQPQLG